MSNQSKTSYIQQHFQVLFYAGLFIGFALALLYSHHQILTGASDQAQMIYKGYKGAYLGIWQNFGNAASAVGNVPGSLSAYLIGMPIILWDSPWSPMLLLLSLRLAGFLLLHSVIKQVFSQETQLVFLVLYWLNPWFLFETLLYNPAYLSFFAALHFYTAFNMRENKSILYSFFHLLSIGMAMQLHYSWPILAVISAYLFYRGTIKISWTGISLAFLLIIASLIPYFQELLVNEDLVRSQGNKDGERYIGWGGVHVYPVLKAFLYWLRYASFIFTNRLITSAHFEWLSSIETIQMIVMYLWRALLFGAGGLSIWIAWKAHKHTWMQIRSRITRKSKDQDLSLENWLLLYAVGAIIGVTISAILSPIVFNHWHLISIFAFALFPLLVFIETLSKNSSIQLSKYLFIVAFYFIFVNLVAANDSEKFSYKVSYQAQTIEYLKEKELLK